MSCKEQPFKGINLPRASRPATLSPWKPKNSISLRILSGIIDSASWKRPYPKLTAPRSLLSVSRVNVSITGGSPDAMLPVVGWLPAFTSGISPFSTTQAMSLYTPAWSTKCAWKTSQNFPRLTIRYCHTRRFFHMRIIDGFEPESLRSYFVFFKNGWNRYKLGFWNQYYSL